MSITFWFNAYSMQKCLLSLLPLWRGFLNEENILFLIVFPQQVPVSFPGSSDGKESACSGDLVWSLGPIPGSGRSPAEGLGNPLQYSCLESSMDRGAWWAIVHEVTKNWTQRSVCVCVCVCVCVFIESLGFNSLIMICLGFFLFSLSCDGSQNFLNLYIYLFTKFKCSPIISYILCVCMCVYVAPVYFFSLLRL